MSYAEYKAGVFGLTFICGLIDAACFLALGGVFAELMTGNLLQFAFSVGSLHFQPSHMVTYGSAIGAFCLGALLAGMAANGRIRFQQSGDHAQRARVIGYPVEFAMVLTATILAIVLNPAPESAAILDSDAHVPIDWDAVSIVALLAFSMGIHNALMRRHSIPDVATNVMTLTFAGLISDSRLAGGKSPHWQRRLGSILLFIGGAGLGAFLLRFGVAAPLIAATAVFAVVLHPLVKGRVEGAEIGGYTTASQARN